jgi:Holliday junction DNA helicase RuvA
MLSHLNGKVIDRNFSNNTLVLELNDFGFLILTSTANLQKISCGERRTIYVHLSANELGIKLCGFLSRAEKELFELLITVSGIGPKAALKILDQFSVEEFIPAVIREDVNLISKAQGIGKKTAERIVLELKTKFKKIIPTGVCNPDSKSPIEVSNNRLLASDILNNLGFDPLEVERKLNQAQNENIADDVELLVKYCLKAS